MVKRVVSVSFVFLFVAGSKPFNPYDDGGLSFDGQKEMLSAQIVKLHEMEGPAKTNVIWYECGKKIGRVDASVRANEYSSAIMSSVQDVYEKTGEWVDPRYPVAILYRESSFDECIIGKRETNRLAEKLGRQPNKKERVKHIRLWMKARAEAKKWCKEKKPSWRCVGGCLDGGRNKLACRRLCKVTEMYSACVRGRMDMQHPEYRGIHGWDLGAAQFRWPGYGYRGRNIQVDAGKSIEDVSVDDLFDYRVAIKMLVENLSGFRVACGSHKHYSTNRRSGRRGALIPTEDAYFAHHHTGPAGWSEKYWRAVNRHLSVINKWSQSPVVARVSLPVALRQIFF